MAIWGKPAAGGTYAAIAALTNIPATILAATFHEFFLADSSRGELLSPRFVRYADAVRLVITPAHVDMMVGHKAHMEHSGLSPVADHRDAPSPSYGSDNKVDVETIEKV